MSVINILSTAVIYRMRQVIYEQMTKQITAITECYENMEENLN